MSDYTKLNLLELEDSIGDRAPEIEGRFGRTRLGSRDIGVSHFRWTVAAQVRVLRLRLADRVPANWTPHWFRHTHATALLLSGTPLHVVARRLGHADVQTTQNLYAWVTEDAELRALADWRAFTEGWRTNGVAG